MTEDYERAAVLRDAKAISESGLLTEREAQAYLMVNVHGWDVERAADAMHVSKSRVYNARQAAEKDLQSARETLKLLDSVEADGRNDLIPNNCSNCGSAIQEWTTDNGRIVCTECAGIEV